ncbi:uncharacterized protein LOC130691871 [Daphnia carinata]|uniref:uncharacterized protein LOC130691871 n=1 Tax=Daphnia carinata TaxID=120202 RepID=UPI00257BC7C5|nr:uncharacterized protein LOC130691871 [Daphnia carinata]
MNFDSFFRQFFGLSHPAKRPSEEGLDEDSRNLGSSAMFHGAQWNSELDQLDKIMIKLLKESFESLSMFTDVPLHQEHLDMPVYPQASLRDQMLKPGFTDQPNKEDWKPERNIKAGVNVDETTKDEKNLAVLLPKAREDGMYYSTRSSTNYFHSSNGATESKSTINDRDGCYRDLTTKEFNGKKYVMERKQCPGAPPQTTETLINLSREELPEFLKNWRTDQGVGNQDMFDFWGSFK